MASVQSFTMTTKSAFLFSGTSTALAASVNIQSRRKTSCAGNIIRCQASKSDVSIWLGRAAMLGFVATVGVEIGTGKGLLETAGLSAPAPTLALGLTALVGLFTAFRIFTSVSKD